MSHKAGFVNLIGRPNAGKSTLMNQLVGEQMSIITPKAQTTRHRIVGIVNEDDYQIVYSDTPGMLEPKYALQANMMTFVKEALKDADILILIIDIADKNMEFFGFDKALTEMETPMLIALNKVDISDQTVVEAAVERLKQTFPNAEIMPVSALHAFGIDHLKNRVHALLPESPPYYEKDALTDKPMRFFVSEIIRERILENYQKEIPYSVQVEIEAYVEEENIVRISAVIYVARKSQKGIIIGHQGQKLKTVGTEARLKMEEFIGKKVFLEMHVKVDEDWRNKDRSLKAYGYKKS
ncbi:GTPase Era [Cryomorpha ignava]|uniref:GTPase Era n=1 Tax=Cryomorpha ignava TaxID=101383 RepID=A0A7K3WQI1_9FLAO|nr:GTPase Era [Cryomorpha ignava]NEN23015.1 GTPase Era [Cryomorpha ignava]